MTGLHLIVVSAIIIITALACFMLGWLTRSRNDAELIGQLEAELDARQAVMPPEIAHEPEPAAACGCHCHDPGGHLLVLKPEDADTAWDLPVITRRQGFISLPDWHRPAAGDLEEYVAVMGAALQEHVAALIAASETA